MSTKSCKAVGSAFRKKLRVREQVVKEGEVAQDKRDYSRRGEDHHRATLTDRDVELMRQMHEEGDMTLYDLAAAFGISKSHVGDIVSYKKRV